MDKEILMRTVEALLFVSNDSLSQEQIGNIIEDVKPGEISGAIEQLKEEYAKTGRTFQIVEVAGGWQMMTDPSMAKWVRRLYKRAKPRLSAPSLETLAIIAYRQPLARSEIEMIRGVNVDGVIYTLMERGLIKVAGHKDAPGRPILYGTTKEFLQHFGLNSLRELPMLKEFKESDLDFSQEQIIPKETEDDKEKREEETAALPASTAEESDRQGGLPDTEVPE